VGNCVWCRNALQDAGVELETVRCERDAGNAELHGAEHRGTIQQAAGQSQINTEELDKGK
jgi:hypothetical protein